MTGAQGSPGPENGVETVRIELGARSYDILVGAGLIAQAGALLAPLLRSPRVVVVTDETVARLHGPRLSAALAAAGIQENRVALPPGERTKSLGGLERLLDRLLESKPDRELSLIAFGGGVIGDLTGLAASVLLRGVDFIQMPTTLLAQVDSSIGGKTGVNTRHGKNLVGTFHQPRLVLADTEALDTLPERELRAGYAEVVKYALIGDAAFFGWLEANAPTLLAGDRDARRHAIVTSCTAKARIVSADERETGMRSLLNLGHTFAHALEAAGGYGPELLHGEAVAAGLVLAFDLSARLGFCSPDHAARIARHLASVGLPAGLRDLAGGGPDADALIAHMAYDKKVRQGRNRFVLAHGIGDAFIADDVPVEEVRAVIEAARLSPRENAAGGSP